MIDALATRPRPSRRHSSPTARRIFVAAVLAVAGAVAAPRADAQEAVPDDAAGAEMRRRMAEAALPGPAHDRLAALAGEWRVETRIRSAHGAEPVFVKGSAEARMVLGGRFLVVETRSGEGRLASEGLMVLGFDRRAGEYTAVVFDTWGTYHVTGRGPYDAGAGTAVMSGTDDDPITGTTQRYDFVLRFDDADRFVFEVVFHDDAHTGGAGPLTMVRSVHIRR